MTNEEFNAMSPAEKRVAIARDVVCQIKGGNVIPTHGLYVMAGKSGGERKHIGPGKLTAEFLSQAQSCFACALGSMVVSAVKGSGEPAECGNYTSTREQSSNAAYGYLMPYFDSGQLTDIERAFEGGENGNSSRFGKSPLGGVVDPGERIAIIMDNVVRNGGEFVKNDSVFLAKAKAAGGVGEW